MVRLVFYINVLINRSRACSDRPVSVVSELLRTDIGHKRPPKRVVEVSNSIHIVAHLNHTLSDRCFIYRGLLIF